MQSVEHWFLRMKALLIRILRKKEFTRILHLNNSLHHFRYCLMLVETVGIEWRLPGLDIEDMRE